MSFFHKKRVLTTIGIIAVFVAVFAAGYAVGHANSEEASLRLFGDRELVEAKESDITVPLSEVQITPDIILDEETGEETEEPFVELTESNAIVSTASEIYTYDDMLEDMYALCGKYPDILAYDYIGTSFDGRDLYAITLGNYEAPHSVMAVASLNGSEYMSTMLVMKLLEYYAYYYEHGFYEGLAFSELFQNTAIRVLTMANPDGVTLSQMGISALNNEEFKELVNTCYERDKWYLEYTEVNGKKQWLDHYDTPEFNVYLAENPTMITLEEYTTIWNSNAYGVEIGRNFDVRWDELTLKPEQSYDGYMGVRALTEVETALVFSMALDRDYDYFINYGGGEKALGAGSDAGTFAAWVGEALGRECIEVVCAEKQGPFSLYDFEVMYEQNKDAWAHLAYLLN